MTDRPVLEAVGEVLAPLRWAYATGETFKEMAETVQLTALYQYGDCVLVWVNEGDLHMHSMVLSPTPIVNAGEGEA